MHNAPPAPGDEGQGAGHLRASHLWGECERVEQSSYLLSRLPAGRRCWYRSVAACFAWMPQRGMRGLLWAVLMGVEHSASQHNPSAGVRTGCMAWVCWYGLARLPVLEGLLTGCVPTDRAAQCSTEGVQWHHASCFVGGSAAYLCSALPYCMLFRWAVFKARSACSLWCDLPTTSRAGCLLVLCWFRLWSCIHRSATVCVLCWRVYMGLSWQGVSCHRL